MVAKFKFNFRGLWFAGLVLAFSSCTAQEIQVLPGKVEAQTVLDDQSPNQLSGASIFQIPGYFVWGGSVMQGEDGKYHMFFSLWESGQGTDDFIKSWVLQSKIGYAVSDYPDRDFEFQKIVLKGRRYEGDALAWDAQMVHNPHVKKFNDKYYLYYIGSRDPGPQPAGSTGENLDKRARVQQSLCIGVISFDSIEEVLSGEFVRPEQPLLIPRTRVKPDHILHGSPKGTEAKPDNIIVVNPSVVLNPVTGKYMLYFKGNIYEPHWKGVHGVALSDSPAGPFKSLDQFMFDIKMPDGTIASTEDPYVWYWKKYHSFFAVVKDFTGRISGVKKALALLTSKDGISWKVAGNPLFMKKELYLQSGSVLKVDRLERPQLLLDSKGTPKVMYAACSLGNVNIRNDGSSFNVQIPLEIANE